jgi:hypothetical protein
MEILKVRALQGPNVWGRGAVLEAHVMMAEYAHLSVQGVLAFEGRLAASLPGWSPPPVPLFGSP